MAIVFDCPHCRHPYRLKDEFAGKRATCKNPDCRQVIVIPQPSTNGALAPDLPPAEVEAAALSALAEEAPNPQQGAAAPAEKVIPMACEYCGHKWTEPMAKAGKNVLCPNPECRQRVKVPEPKEDTPDDWRQQKTKLPTLAKGNVEKPADVQDAADAKIVSGEAIRQSGALDEEFEPRPLKQKVMFVLLAVGLVGGLAFGIWYLIRSRDTGQEGKLMAEAREEFKKVAGELAPAQAPLYSAMLNAAEAEYALRKNTAEDFKKATEAFGKARDDVRRAQPGPERNAVAAELAFTAIAFGGTDEQVKNQTRYRWLPDSDSRTLRVNEKSQTVHEELLRTLQGLQSAEFEFRVGLARRLARELAKKGQAELAANTIQLGLFSDAERDEGRAVIALELYRADKGSAVARTIANELKAKIEGELKDKNNPGVKGRPIPASAQTLFLALALEGAPVFIQPPTANRDPGDLARLAYTGKLLLEGNSEAALALAKQQGEPAHQLKSLVLYAEWASDPGPALDAARGVIAANRSKPNVNLPSYYILRLSQIAAETNRAEQARELADFLPDEGLKAWAKGDAVRLRVAASPKDKAEEGWVEVPDKADKLRAGHAWGRLWVARQNAKLSGNRDDEKKAVAGWSPTPIHPFGLAGIALGLQDR
jgi:hypothetical protein